MIVSEYLDKLQGELQAAVTAKHAADGYTNFPADTVKLNERRDFYALDIGSSGAFMVRKDDGAIFGIKGYGTPDYRKGIGYVHDTNGADLLTWRFRRGPFRTDMR